MAVINSVSFAAILLLATSYAAPTKDNFPLVEFPPECIGQQFCTIKPKGYDLLEDRINSLLPEYLKQDYADRNGLVLPPPIYSPDNDIHNCPSVTKTELIYGYSHGENKTKIDLVIQTKLLTQTVTMVDCDYNRISKEIKADLPQCFQDVTPGLYDMKSKCAKTWGQQSIYVFDEERGNLTQRLVKVPVACSCQLFKIRKTY